MTAQPVEPAGVVAVVLGGIDVRAAGRPRLRLLPVPVNEPPLTPRAVAIAATPVGDPGHPPTAPAAAPAPAPKVTKVTKVPTAARFTADRRPVRDRASSPLPLVGLEDEAARSRPERATATAELPAPAPWVVQFVQAATEVAVGLRPAVQLVRWTSEDVYTRLARRGDVAARARCAGRLGSQGQPGRPRVRSVRTVELRDGIIEASAVISDADRTRAVALRLEGVDGRWRVTVLELG